MKLSKKTIISGIAVVILLAVFIYNNFFGGSAFSSTCYTADGSWSSVSWTVDQGDADKLTVTVDGSNKVEIRYDGEYDLVASVALTDADGSVVDYDLHIYEEYNTATEHYEIMCYFEPVD